MDPWKMKSITEWISSENALDVWIFMESSGYYRRLCRGYIYILKDITTLQWKGIKYEIIEECNIAFPNMKGLLSSVTILWVPDMDKDFSICIYSSKQGLGVLLMKYGLIIVYMSSKFNIHEYIYILHA